MSEQLPYDDAFEDRLNDLPLPDSEQAWQKMKVMLDEEDRKRRLLPPVFFSCALWSLLGLALLAGAWFIFARDKKEKEAPVSIGIDKKSGSPVTQKQTTTLKRNTTLENDTVKPVPGDATVAISNKQPSVPDQSDNETVSKKKVEPLPSSASKEAEDKVPSFDKSRKVTKSKSKRAEVKTANTSAYLFTAKRKKQNDKAITFKATSRTTTAETKASGITDTSAYKPDVSLINKADSSATGKELTAPIEDTVTKKDSLAKADTATLPAPEIQQSKKGASKKLYALSVGIGEQQGINIKGQAAVPYNYYGRNSSLSDYIPSVYIRLHKGEQWFLQGEFRYGAPQSIKEFSFSQQTKYDTATTSLVTTTTRIKKTFYHQVPLSFNYYILPHWSVGAGAMYSLFQGAITEQETKNKNVLTGAEVNTKQIVRVPTYTDSFLYKTQWHVLFQTDYQSKRFSIGLRYQKDLQPFIKYTDPAGVVHTEKNQSFDVFIRFQLWKSKSFSF